MLSTGLLADSNWLILSAIVLPRFLEPQAAFPVSHLVKLLSMCNAASVDLFRVTEVASCTLLSEPGGEVFSFAECRGDRLFTDEGCPFFPEGGDLNLVGF